MNRTTVAALFAGALAACTMTACATTPEPQPQPEPEPVEARELDAQAVREVLASNHGAMVECYERYAPYEPAVDGQFLLNVLVGRDGAVREVNVTESDIQHPELEGCVLRAAQRWQFPATGQNVYLNIPYAFPPRPWEDAEQ